MGENESVDQTTADDVFEPSGGFPGQIGPILFPFMDEQDETSLASFLNRWPDLDMNKDVPEERAKMFQLAKELQKEMEAIGPTLDAQDRTDLKRFLSFLETFRKVLIQEEESLTDLQSALSQLVDLADRFRGLTENRSMAEYLRKRLNSSTFRDRCRRFIEETKNKAFAEQLRDLDDRDMHEESNWTKEDRLKLSKALFSAGTHSSIEREQSELDEVIERRIIDMLKRLHEGAPPREIFSEAREMLRITERPDHDDLEDV